MVSRLSRKHVLLIRDPSDPPDYNRKHGIGGFVFLSPCETFAWQSDVNGRIIKVSPDRAKLLRAHLWYIQHDGYVVRKEHGIKVFLHLCIKPSLDGYTLDHKDRDKTNCVDSNLRYATKAQQAYNRGVKADNTSGYKGVHKRNDRGVISYRACITHNGKRESLGSFPTPEDAALAYDKRARELHGEFAVLNYEENSKC